MRSLHPGYLVDNIVPVIQSRHTDNISCLYVSHAHDIRLNLKTDNLISHILHKIAEQAVTPFLLLRSPGAFHRTGIQCLNIVNHHIFCHIRSFHLLPVPGQSTRRNISQRQLIKRIKSIVDRFTVATVLREKKFIDIKLFPNQ